MPQRQAQELPPSFISVGPILPFHLFVWFRITILCLALVKGSPRRMCRYTAGFGARASTFTPMCRAWRSVAGLEALHDLARSSARSRAIGSGVPSTPAGSSRRRSSRHARLPELDHVLPHKRHPRPAQGHASFLGPEIIAHSGVHQRGLRVLHLLLAILAGHSPLPDGSATAP